jgi:hypothetical protein
MDHDDQLGHGNIPKYHIRQLADIFVRHNVQESFGIHLIHRHFTLPSNTVMVGEAYYNPYCRWAKPRSNNIEPESLTGYLFALTEDQWHPYEYQKDFQFEPSSLNEEFLDEVTQYVLENDLSHKVALQLLGSPYDRMDDTTLELLLNDSSIMFRFSNLIDCSPVRQTGWQFALDGRNQPRTCQYNESHGTLPSGQHQVYNQGQLEPKFRDYTHLKDALIEKGVLRC